MLVTTLTSCDHHHPTVMYDNGKVESVTDDVLFGDSGDSVIVEHYVTTDSALGLYSSDKIWGRYKGIIPNESFNSSTRRTSRTWYEKAVIQ